MHIYIFMFQSKLLFFCSFLSVFDIPVKKNSDLSDLRMNILCINHIRPSSIPWDLDGIVDRKGVLFP